jgi:hypothetical protein
LRICLGIGLRLEPAWTGRCGLQGFAAKKSYRRFSAAARLAGGARRGGLVPFEGSRKPFGSLPVEQGWKLARGPRQAGAEMAPVMSRRENQAAEQQSCRHRHRAERKPSAAPAIGRDQENEKDNPGSEKTQRVPPRQSLWPWPMHGAKPWRQQGEFKPKTGEELPTSREFEGLHRP